MIGSVRAFLIGPKKSNAAPADEQHYLGEAVKRLAVTVTIPDRFLPQIVIALEHHAAYLNATKRDGRPFQDISRDLQRKVAAKTDTVPASRSHHGSKRRRAK